MNWLADRTPLLAIAIVVAVALIPPATAGSAQQETRAVTADYERLVYGIEVLGEDGTALDHPFLGGLNLPRPQLADIDGDGDLDLFVQEYSDGVMFFENVAISGAPEYRWRTDRYKDLPVGEWYLFVDLDGDGDLDLLGEEPFSRILYWRNDGGPTDPQLNLVGSMLDPAGERVFSDRQNIPKLGDLDCDGRLDLLIGRVEGIITRYEAAGFTDSGEPVFRFVEDRFQDIEIIGQAGQPGGAIQRGVQQGSALHGANTMALEDIDRDGDLDLFWGDFFEAGVLFIENTGSCRSPSMRREPRAFPRNDPVETSGYNAPAFGDVDGDGDSDLLVGVLGGAFNPQSTSIDNLWFLEQESPSRFAARTSRFISQLDVGSETIPALADTDGDGDLDLYIGNKIQQDDSNSGALFLFENVGSGSAPRFAARGAVEGFTGHYHFAPAFGDLDADGDLDIILGTWDDELQLIRNQGSASSPVWVLEEPVIVKLSRGRNATPALGDLDGDGDLDLIVGESSGELNYWRNDGSTAAPQFELVDDKFLSADAGRRSAPTLHDIDKDGDLDLIVGSENDGLWLYRNQGSVSAARFEYEGQLPARVLPFAAPVFGDLDGDGGAELLTGTIAGGVGLYEAGR
jgi:hypothetical protein